MTRLDWTHKPRRNNRGQETGDNLWEADVGNHGRVWIVDSHIYNRGCLTYGGSGLFDFTTHTKYGLDDLEQVKVMVEARCVDRVLDLAFALGLSEVKA